MNCKYMCQSLLEWMLNNKIIVFLSLLTFCLFVSTLALAGQRNRLSADLDECRALVTTPATETPTETPTPDPTEEGAAPTEATEAPTEATAAPTEATQAPSETADGDAPTETPSVPTETAALQARGSAELHDSDNEVHSNSVREGLQNYGLLTKLIAS